MEIFVVGGAVRDRLLGLPVHDRDYVVVGATPEQMMALGYLPVGRDFPVFLHPESREEYALARTERKTAPGYAGFSFHAAPDVTLEDDLLRRDLTINAMAETLDGRQLIDPFGGQRDLARRLFRHVGPSFVEDPVRLLRLARFAARFADFEVAEETEALLGEMVQAGEVDALIAERVWAELARGLMAARPARMVQLLDRVGALARIGRALPADGRALAVLDRAAQQGLSLPVRFAVWLNSAPLAPQQVMASCTQLRVPREVRELAVMASRYGEAVLQAAVHDNRARLNLLEALDALRRPERFEQLLEVLAVLADESHAAAQARQSRAVLCAALACIRQVDAAVVAQAVTQAVTQAAGRGLGQDVKQAVHAARLAALDAQIVSALPQKVQS